MVWYILVLIEGAIGLGLLYAYLGMLYVFLFYYSHVKYGESEIKEGERKGGVVLGLICLHHAHTFVVVGVTYKINMIWQGCDFLMPTALSAWKVNSFLKMGYQKRGLSLR